MRRRTNRIGVWLSDAEYRYLKQQSAFSGLGMEAFVRSLVMGTEIRPRPPEQYAALLRQLSGIGTNLNQLAHVANASRSVNADQLREAEELARQAWRLVKEAF